MYLLSTYVLCRLSSIDWEPRIVATLANGLPRIGKLCTYVPEPEGLVLFMYVCMYLNLKALCCSCMYVPEPEGLVLFMCVRTYVPEPEGLVLFTCVCVVTVFRLPVCGDHSHLVPLVVFMVIHVTVVMVKIP